MGKRDREPVRIGTFEQAGYAFVRAHPRIGIPSLTSERDFFECFKRPVEKADADEGEE